MVAYNVRTTKINSFAFRIEELLALATPIIFPGDSIFPLESSFDILILTSNWHTEDRQEKEPWFSYLYDIQK